jgi:hypothetical protein
MKSFDRIFFTLTLIFIFFSGFAQDSNIHKEVSINTKVTFKLKGFIRNDIWYDTRQELTARDDLFNLYPKNVSLDMHGKDLNANGSFNIIAIATRLNMALSGPDAFLAKTSGVIEADFTGVSNDDVNGLRLRLAYAKLRWKHAELLFGQNWHPLFVEEAFPQIPALNTGAPFHPFIRNPQICLSFFTGKSTFKFAAIAQRDNMSDGPKLTSSTYMRNSMVPNFHAQYQLKLGKNLTGIGADYKILRPQLATPKNYQTYERISSYAFMGFWKYENPKFFALLKAIYGQNLSEHLMVGGYAVATRDSFNFLQTYTPTNHLFLTGNIVYGKSLQYGLFGGYIKNFGTSSENIGEYFGRGNDIDHLYRVTAFGSIKVYAVKVQLEFEYTTAAYGTPDHQGIVKNWHEVSDFRTALVLMYLF